MKQSTVEKIYKQMQTGNGKQPVFLYLGIDTFTNLCKELYGIKKSVLTINQKGDFSLWGIKIKIDYFKRDIIKITY